MHLTLEEMRIVHDALECACKSKLKEFEDNKDRCDIEAKQSAVRAAGDIKRYQRLMSAVRQQISRGA